MRKIELKENELYQEIDLLADGVKIGSAEVDLKGKTLSRLMIDTAFQDRGYGQGRKLGRLPETAEQQVGRAAGGRPGGSRDRGGFL